MIWSFAMIAGLLLYMTYPEDSVERQAMQTRQDVRRTHAPKSPS